MAMNRRDHDQRAEHRHYDGSLTTQGTVSTLLRSASFDKTSGNRMVLTYNDVGHTPKCPQIGVLLNNRATKLAAFLLYRFGGKVVAFGWAQFCSVQFAAKMSVLRLSKGLEIFAWMHCTFSSHFPAVCPHPSLLETSNVCYLTVYNDGPELPFDIYSSRAWCLAPSGTGTWSVPVKITSQEQQDAIVKAISSTASRKALHIWTGLKVQRKVFNNGTFSSISWLDEMKRPLPYANFADNQNPVGVACVVLSKKKNYKWITVDCFHGYRAGSIACQAGKGMCERVPNHCYVSRCMETETWSMQNR